MTTRARPMILLVDDDDAFRFQVREALFGEDFHISEASTAEDALDLFSLAPADMVLLDVKLPGMDGIEACKAIRSLPGGRDVAVVMVTAYEDFKALRQALEAGASDFITKPVNWPLLRYRLRYVLQANKAFRDLRSSERRLAQAQRITRIGSWDRDLLRDTMYWSPEVYGILDLDPAIEPSFAVFMEQVHDEDRASVEEAMDAALNDLVPVDIEYRVHGPNNRLRFLHMLAEVVTGENGEPVSMYGTIRDISRRKRNEARIRRLAYYDSLTGLPNRQFFKEHAVMALAAAKRRREKAALMFLDIDHFKEVNDSLGHEAGDAMLKRIAACLLDSVRGSDMVAPSGTGDQDAFFRFGGDEFAILLTQIRDVADVAEVARRILRRLQDPIAISGRNVHISASLGIAMFPDDGEDIEVLLKSADIAMYHAKQEGRNGFSFFSPRMNFGVMERLRTEDELRAALDDSRFTARFQPFVEDGSGRVVGLEGILQQHLGGGRRRYVDGLLGQVHDRSILVTLFQVLLEQSLALYHTARQQDLDTGCLMLHLPSAVLEDDLVDLLHNHLDKVGADPRQLCLILEESVVNSPPLRLRAAAKRLRAMGVSLAVSDIGGHCIPLHGMRSLDVDTLIIGPEFVSNARSNGIDVDVLAEAVIKVALAMDLTVMAEGINSSRQLELFRRHGCRLFKGREVAPVLYAADVLDYLENYTKEFGALPRSCGQGGPRHA